MAEVVTGDAREYILSGEMKKGDLVSYISSEKKVVVYIEGGFGVFNEADIRLIAEELLNFADEIRITH